MLRSAPVPCLWRWAALLCLGVVFTACSNPIAESPPVSDSTMVEVLVDLHLATHRYALERDVPPSLRDSILMHHGVDTARYAEAIAFYAAHPKRYAEVYGDLTDRLRAARERLDTRATVRKNQ